MREIMVTAMRAHTLQSSSASSLPRYSGWQAQHWSRSPWLFAAATAAVATVILQLLGARVDTPVSLLYAASVAMVAAEFGAVTGALVGLLGTSAFVGWFAVSGVAVESLSVVERGLLLVGVGLAVGWVADQRNRELATTRAVLEALPEPASVKDVSGRYLLVNAALERMLHRPREEIVGQQTGFAQSLEVSERVARADREVLESRAPVEFELTGDVPGVSGVVMRTIKAPVLDRRGRVIAIVTVAHDISDRVEHERRVVDLVNQARSEYERAIHDYSRLVRHRVVNPLTIIQGVGETMRTSFADTPQHREQLAAMLGEQVIRLAAINLRAEQAGPEECELCGVPEADVERAMRESNEFASSIRHPFDW